VVVIAGRQRYDDPAAALPCDERVNGVQVHRVGSTRYGRHGRAGRLLDYASFIVSTRRKLKEVVDAQTVVVAKTDPPMLGMFLESIVRTKGGRLVNWLQDLFPETLTALYRNPVVAVGASPLRFLRNRSLKRAIVNIVIDRRMRDHLLSEGVRSSRLGVIRNWAYDAPAGQQGPARDFRAEWELDGRFVVGHFGNLGRAHDYETVLGAMMALESDSRIVFLFVGGGVLLEKLKEKVEEYGLTNFVHRDYVAREDLPEALAAADAHLVVLQPGLEGFVVPSKIAGVLAARRPVLYVGDPRGEIGGMVRKKQCGYVAEIGDSQGLAGRIRSLAENPESAAARGAAAYAVYQEHYRSELQLERWHKVLSRLERRVA